MSKQIAVLLGLALLALSGLAQDKPKENGKPPAGQPITAEEASQKNPVNSDSRSLAEGKKLFDIDCAMCHGKEGEGKGQVAQQLKFKIPDFRDATAMKSFTDGELFQIISRGRGDMPSEGARAKPEQIWSLINFVRSFAKKDAQ